jgi:tetratricopeptide (TPR) repeat protein
MNRTHAAKKSVRGPRAETAASRLSRGETELENGHYQAALAQARVILRSDPNHLGALELQARAHWRQGDYAQALDALRHLIRLNPYEPGYHFLRAGALQAQGHYGEAVRAYARCLNGENETLAQSAAAAIRQLEDWQEGVIAELLKEDACFRAEYAQDAMAACRKRGFAFAAEDAKTALDMAAVQLPAAEYGRPS